jgi:lipopolysaccharide/colanic/teichoic acid biosynthesis glycosyltransferase
MIPMKEGYILKRPFDLIFSSLGLVISFPLWIIFAIAIWLEDRGPILYLQQRAAKDSTHFNVLKFRTMVPDSDKIYGPLQAEENDIRITRVGKLLRETAMDELPQLINILKGDMSFVGPRALLPIEIEAGENSNQGALPIGEIPGFSKRQSVKPGLTGIAQIYAPRDATRRQKFRFDILYIEKQSIWLDIKLISISFWITFNAKWESREKKYEKSIINSFKRLIKL